MNETKSWFLEKRKKIDKLLAEWIKKKNTQITEIKNENGVINTDFTEIKRIIRTVCTIVHQQIG